jgi:hypothetical protein
MNMDEWSTIGIKKTTKARLDENRAPGQNYDGFIWQLTDLWERAKASLDEKRSPGQNTDGFMWQLVDSWGRTERVGAGSAGGKQGAEVLYR